MFFMINLFKKRQAALVFLITFLIYSPVLFNHFVGDDNVIFGRNTFYHSWKNVPRLFEKGRVISSHEIIVNSESRADLGKVSASFRPILNLTYFLDYYLFQDNPYGLHLISILIHCVNSVLVYRIVNQIFSSSLLGLFAGLLFSLHPIQSEAVAVVNCQCDLLATMFVLFSFYFWTKFQQGGYVSRGHYCNSLAIYSFALFTKESTVTLPLVILFFDQILVARRPGLRKRGIYYIGFIAVLVFYLYLYVAVFPNTSLSFHWLGGSFVNHCLIMGYIWYSYLMNVLFPWTVKAIPGLYCPPVPVVFSLVTAEMGTAFIALITSVFVLWRHYKEAVFFLLWYIIFYLPVSNLVPIANPMADRFMYLPSVGALIVLAFFLHNIFKSGFLKKYSQNLSGLLHVAVIMICITRLLFLNNDWKSNFNMARAWVRDYPSAAGGMLFWGRNILMRGFLRNLKHILKKASYWEKQYPMKS